MFHFELCHNLIVINVYRFKEIRKKHNLTQKELAKNLEINQTRYSNYEIGFCDISIKLLKRLADFYNTSTDYLLDITDEEKPYKKSLIQTSKNRLKEIREDRDLTQYGLCEILEIKRNCYSQYELSLNDIPTKLLIKLAKLYQVSADYILYRTDVRKPYPEKELIKN